MVTERFLFLRGSCAAIAEADNQGRTTAVNYPLSGPQQTLSYDAMGNLSTIGGNMCNAEDNYGRREGDDDAKGRETRRETW